MGKIKYRLSHKFVKVDRGFINLSLKLTGKVMLGKEDGVKYFGFICMRCKRWRQATKNEKGFLVCSLCGFHIEG